MIEIFNDFKARLNKRLSKNIYTSEDSIRYTFFYSLITKGKLRPEDIILEKPFEHSEFKTDKLDLYVIPNDKIGPLAFEFKYNKNESTNSTVDAGSLFWDFVKLVNETKKTGVSAYFIYVLGELMKIYLTRPNRKNLSRLFNLPRKKSMIINRAYFNKFPQSLLSWLKDKDKDYDYLTNFYCKIKSVFASDLSQQHYLRIYKIEG